MSSDGTYPGRASRRVDREPPAAKRASAGAAAAILIIVAIFGFGGGVLLGNASGDEPQTPSADTSGETNSPETAPADDDGDTDESSGDVEITLGSPKDGGEVASGEAGRFEMAGSIDPPVGGIVVTIERSLNGGETWGLAGSSTLTATTSDDGTYSTTFWSGQAGENHFRAVGEDPDGNRIESNTIVVTVASDG